MGVITKLLFIGALIYILVGMYLIALNGMIDLGHWAEKQKVETEKWNPLASKIYNSTKYYTSDEVTLSNWQVENGDNATMAIEDEHDNYDISVHTLASNYVLCNFSSTTDDTWYNINVSKHVELYWYPWRQNGDPLNTTIEVYLHEEKIGYDTHNVSVQCNIDGPLLYEVNIDNNETDIKIKGIIQSAVTDWIYVECVKVVTDWIEYIPIPVYINQTYINVIPGNMTIASGDVLPLVWIINESMCDTYSIYINGTLVQSGNWSTAIMYTFDNDTIGVYNVTLIAYHSPGTGFTTYLEVIEPIYNTIVKINTKHKTKKVEIPPDLFDYVVTFAPYVAIAIGLIIGELYRRGYIGREEVQTTTTFVDWLLGRKESKKKRRR